MTPEQRRRLEELRQEWCSPALVQQLYGLDTGDEKLMGMLRVWAPRVHRSGLIERPGGQMNRHALENFFQFARYLPAKWAAVQLGMAESSFREVLAALAIERLVSEQYAPVDAQPQLVEELLVKDFYKLFAGLRSRIFESHDDYCRRLHAAIRQEHGIEVEPLRCVTALDVLPEDQADYAAAFDVITLEPIGIRFQVWLDLGKPMNLRPDACSTRFYIQEAQVLRPLLLAGTEPEIPAGLQGP